MINKALIRIALQVPGNAEFNIIDLANPYGCQDPSIVSVYRRPLPSTNLRFQSAVMWDGRESSTQTGTQPITFPSNPGDLVADLLHQAITATDDHAQASKPLLPEQQRAIVDFEMALSTAQVIDNKAGFLQSDGATAGPANLGQDITSAFFIGINDPLGQNPRGTAFTPVIFNLFDSWANLKSQAYDAGEQQKSRASILRGQELFNSKPLTSAASVDSMTT